MALDFPSSGLVNGQVYQGTNGIIYTWSAAMGVWLSQGTGSSNASTSTTPPVNPGNGQLWWNSDLGRLMIFFIDASGPPGQWVPATPPQPPLAQPMFRQIARIVPTAGQATVDFQSIPSDINDLEMRFDVQPQSTPSFLNMRYFDGTGTIVATAGVYTFSSLYSYHAAAAGTATGMYASGSAGNSYIMLTLNATGWGAIVSAAHSVQGSVKINNIRETGRIRACEFKTHYLESTGTNYGDIVGGGNLTVAGAITGLRLYFSASNFAGTGAVALYGSP